LPPQGGFRQAKAMLAAIHFANTTQPKNPIALVSKIQNRVYFYFLSSLPNNAFNAFFFRL
jgi:hypothetical protein